MPPTSKKLRGHIGLGLSIRLSVGNTFWQLRNSRTAYARILKFYMWHLDIWHKVTDQDVDELINF